MGKIYRETTYFGRRNYTLGEWNYYCRLRNEYVNSYRNALYSYKNGAYECARGYLYQAQMTLYDICTYCPPASLHNHEYKRAWNDIPRLIEKTERKIQQQEEMCA